MNKYQALEEALVQRKNHHLYRQAKEIELEAYPFYQVEGEKKIMLSSNDYLNFSHNKAIKEYVKQMIDLYPTGSGGARLTTGTSGLHKKLEKALARFKDTEAALIFNTGYMANVGVIQGICDMEYVIFSDECNHASIVDGCRLSQAQAVVYRHNDMDDLEHQIKIKKPKKGLIVTDSVFSMEGDIADLPNLVGIGEKYQLLTMIDEAHATGVMGWGGQGLCQHYNMEQKPDIIVGTMSKALGSEGGFACGSQLLIDYLINHSRSFIFSTALSPITIACSLKALDLLASDFFPVLKLQQNVEYFCGCLVQQGIEARSQTAIVPVIIGNEERTMRIADELYRQGLFISGIRYPTVKKGRAMLRCTITSGHRQDDLSSAAEKIAAAMKKYPA